MSNNLKLIGFTVNSFAKIDQSNPVVIVFPDGKRVLELEGDQAVGKTSIIEAFKSLVGYSMPDNSINKKDQTRKATLEFEKNENKYRVSITKSRFEVELLTDNQWAVMKSPKSIISELVGPIGLNPMFLKEYDGKKQLEWIKSFIKLDEEALEMEKKIESNINSAYLDRRDVNREIKRIDAELAGNDYYTNRHIWEEKIKNYVEPDIKEVQDKYSIYSKAETEVEVLKNSIEAGKVSINSINNKIEMLNLQLAEAELEKKSAEEKVKLETERLAKGETYLHENKDIKWQYQQQVSLLSEAKEMSRHQAEYEKMLQLDKRGNHFHSEYSRLEAILDNYREAKKSFIQALTPQVEGLEIFVADEEEKREGIFYKGMSVAELSESELWTLNSELLSALDIRIIVIENISSLGSSAIEHFNKYVEMGGYILASKMNREEKALKLIISDKIED